jgi:hypothetical protein
VNTAFRSADPIARGHSVREPRELPMPAELLALRHELGLDYGRIDYGVVDGRVVIWDVNKTPSVRTRSERSFMMAKRLAEGVR